MKSLYKKTFFLLFCIFALTACRSKGECLVASEADLPPLQTQIAGTVFAQIALTNSPTAGGFVLDLSRATATITPLDLFAPTETPRPDVTSTPAFEGDAAQWADQNYRDNSAFKPGALFTMEWTLKNIGTTTWTTAYRLQYFSGDPLGSAKVVYIKKPVKPGETVRIAIGMRTPNRVGLYQTEWIMYNAKSKGFPESVFLRIKVGQ